MLIFAMILLFSVIHANTPGVCLFKGKLKKKNDNDRRFRAQNTTD